MLILLKKCMKRNAEKTLLNNTAWQQTVTAGICQDDDPADFYSPMVNLLNAYNNFKLEN